MTVDEASTSSGGSRWKNVAGVVGIVAVIGVIAAIYVQSTNLSRYGVEGRVLWSAKTMSATLGPDGWYVDSGEDTAKVLRHASTGEAHDTGSFADADRILEDGRYLDGGLPLVVRSREGETLAEIPDGALGSDLNSIDVQLVATSDTTVVLRACPDADAVAVVAGFRLDDGGQTWSHQVEGGCASEGLRPVPQTLGEQSHVIIRSGETAARVLSIDDGTEVTAWQDAPYGSITLQDDRIMRQTGQTAVVTDLGTGDRVARTECADAATMNPGGSEVLATEGTLALTCGDSVHLFDSGGGRFVEVHAPAVGPDQLVPDGGSVVHDRYLLARDGASVTITEALSDEEIGGVDVPADFRISTNDPRGRLLVMFRTEDNDDLDTSIRIFDLPSGDELMSESRKLSPGAVVAPDGYAMVTAYGQEEANQFQRMKVTRAPSDGAWLVGIEGQPAR
ncbi:hypothetical protein [Janibacter cremeus]|uniref:Uncharacterized protein n=1 Tax=Janibacter cremeus TaxID=1285192 RepID=A0A852VME7_9MICO|nr:hypothetical protein [Janibacter cremeus]NYF98202.1 hypothetical protein [Janibacter cremeus]